MFMRAMIITSLWMAVRRLVARVDLEEGDLALALAHAVLDVGPVGPGAHAAALDGRLSRLRLWLAVAQNREELLCRGFFR